MVIRNNRNTDFLQAHTAVNEIESAALHFDSHALSSSECRQAGCLIHESDRHQVVRLCSLPHDGIAATVLHIHLIEGGLVHLAVLFQRAISVQEAVISSEDDVCAVHAVGRDAHKVLKLRNRCIMETDQDGMTHTTLKRVPGEGFVFGLYNGDPITYAGGTLEADTLLATAVSDKNGKISFSGQFPHGKYYVRELSGPEGWKLSETDILLIISDEFATENHEIVISLDGPVVNELIHNDVRVSKTDLTGTDYLPHTLIEVKSEDGKTVLKDYTGDDGYLPSFPAVPGKYTYPSETWP